MNSDNYNKGLNYFNNKDYGNAFTYFTKAEEDDEESEACYYLGIMYENGFGVAQDYTIAVRKYKKAEDNPRALFALGRMYEYGKGVPSILSIAVNYYNKAANLDYPEAYKKLGDLYKEGRFFAKDEDKAEEYYQKAKSLGHKEEKVIKKEVKIEKEADKDIEVEKHVEVEKHIEIKKEDIKIEPEKDLTINKNNVESGEYTLILKSFGINKVAVIKVIQAITGLGLMGAKKVADYVPSIILEHIALEDAEVFKKALVKAGGEVEIKKETNESSKQTEIVKNKENIDIDKAKKYFEEGFKYYSGTHGYRRDYKEAIRNFELGSNLGNSRCSMFLGQMAERGEGMDIDDDKAVKYYTKAVKQDENNDLAWVKVGNLYYFGYSVELNYVLAKKAYLLAFNLGNGVAAQKLGDIYLLGRGVKTNFAKAKFYYEKGIEFGDKQKSTYNLGLFYEYGTGVNVDYTKAFTLFKESSDNGYSSASSELGFMYLQGTGFKINYSKAREYFLKAIEQDNKNGEAYYYLGLIYDNGYGVTVDLAKAILYYEKGADLGNKAAKDRLDEINKIAWGDE